MNDSDLLLERVICTLPKAPTQSWYKMDDAYGSSLWDIYPTCQIAGIGEDDTVIIDGAFATCIRWKSFHPVWSARRQSWKRWIAWKLLHFASTFVITGIVLMALGAPSSTSTTYEDEFGNTYSQTARTPANIPYILLGIILFLLGLSSWFMSPRLLQIILKGKFWDTQAAMFGFEGYLNLPTIERAIFGGAFNRLSWSTNGSPLSRHMKNEFGECIGLDPTDDIEVRNLVERAKSAKPGEQRVCRYYSYFSISFLTSSNIYNCHRPPPFQLASFLSI